MISQNLVNRVRKVFSVITGRKKVEETLKESEKTFHSLFNSMTEGALLHKIVRGKDGKEFNYEILEVNPASSAILGRDMEEAKGKLGTDFYNVEKAPYLKEYLEVVNTGEPFSFKTYYKPLNKHFKIKVFSYGIDKFATVFEDITGRKKIEEKLIQSENIFNEIPVGLYVYPLENPNDKEGKTLRMISSNEASKNMTGVSIEDVVGKTLDENFLGLREKGTLPSIC